MNRTYKVLLYFLADIKNRLFNPVYKIKSLSVGGHNLRVYRGTFTKVDKDDAWLAFLMKEAKVIFDVGANIGWTAILANLYGRPERIVLIDPNPIALTYAAGNLIMNDFSIKASFVKAFASNAVSEKIKFYTVDTGAAGSMYPSHAKTASSLNSWFWVSTTTIDEIIARLALVPDFIKIDVEGAERFVLEGASNIAKTNRPTIFVEMHSNKHLTMAENANSVLKWCETVDYKAWYMAEATEMKSSDQVKHRGRCHLLLMHKQLSFPEGLAKIKQGQELPTNANV